MTDSAEKKYNRRDVLKSGGTAVTLGMLAAAFGATLPRGAQAGGTIEETAQALEISDATVKREWTLARAWLKRELSNAT